jgi:hypothetical protein
VTIYGAKRTNHGTYTANVDGNGIETFNGSVPTNIFQTPLYSQVNLANGAHTVTITDTASAYLDIDFVSNLYAKLE